jgi:hypothetical protein
MAVRLDRRSPPVQVSFLLLAPRRAAGVARVPLRTTCGTSGSQRAPAVPRSTGAVSRPTPCWAFIVAFVRPLQPFPPPPTPPATTLAGAQPRRARRQRLTSSMGEVIIIRLGTVASTATATGLLVISCVPSTMTTPSPTTLSSAPTMPSPSSGRFVVSTVMITSPPEDAEVLSTTARIVIAVSVVGTALLTLAVVVAYVVHKVNAARATRAVLTEMAPVPPPMPTAERPGSVRNDEKTPTAMQLRDSTPSTLYGGTSGDVPLPSTQPSVGYGVLPQRPQYVDGGRDVLAASSRANNYDVLSAVEVGGDDEKLPG